MSIAYVVLFGISAHRSHNDVIIDVITFAYNRLFYRDEQKHEHSRFKRNAVRE